MQSPDEAGGQVTVQLKKKWILSLGAHIGQYFNKTGHRNKWRNKSDR